MFGGKFERHAGAGGVLEEKVQNRFPAQQVRKRRFGPSLLLDDIREDVASIDQPHDLERVEAFNSEKMTGCQRGGRRRAG